MARLTKTEAKRHAAAEEMLANASGPLSHEDRSFVFENWNPGANHVNSQTGAFFTPEPIADIVGLFCAKPKGGRILDACAGIGVLANSALSYDNVEKNIAEMICVERNPDYVDIGRRLVPEATWIRGDLFDEEVRKKVGPVHEAISNPPFGQVNGHGHAHLAVASRILDYTVVGGGATMVFPTHDTSQPRSDDERVTHDQSNPYRKWCKNHPKWFIQPTEYLAHCRHLWVGVSPNVCVANLDFDYSDPPAEVLADPEWAWLCTKLEEKEAEEIPTTTTTNEPQQLELFDHAA
jgi:predicted RNA methylase